MGNSEQIASSESDGTLPAASSGMQKWLIIVGVALISVLVVSAAVQGWLIYKMRKDISGLQWSDAIHERDGDSELTTDVGTIQFTKKGGYSITLDTAKYTGDGLYLHGEIGNPTYLTITNLAIKFTATKQLYQYEDDFDKDPWVMFAGPPAIGEAQTSPIVYLGPGKAATFEVTIPNVKQTKEGVRLVVSFGGGERYAYGY